MPGPFKLRLVFQPRMLHQGLATMPLNNFQYRRFQKSKTLPAAAVFPPDSPVCGIIATNPFCLAISTSFDSSDSCDYTAMNFFVLNRNWRVLGLFPGRQKARELHFRTPSWVRAARLVSTSNVAGSMVTSPLRR
jgi:hypothetical protein